MTRIAQESSAEALQYGPTEGFAETKQCIRELMRGRGDGSGPRRPDRHHRRPAGDRPDHEDAGRPRRCRDRRGADVPRRGPGSSARIRPRPCRWRSTPRGCGVDALGGVARPARRGRGRRPKFIYSVPSFQNPAGVTMSVERAAPGRDAARASCRSSRTTRTGALVRGRRPRAADYGARVGHVVYLGSLSKVLSPGCGSAGVRTAGGDREGGARQAGRGPLHRDLQPAHRP